MRVKRRRNINFFTSKYLQNHLHSFEFLYSYDNPTIDSSLNR